MALRPGRRTTRGADGEALDVLRDVIAGPEAVTRGIRTLARHDPAMFGELLAPTIGTAVRRAVADALAAMLQRFNELLDHSFSLRGLAWRLEARRTGRSLPEVVLAHTLVYRVEWVVLIDTESSLVLEEVALPDAPAKAPDQVSAMLRAIGAFVSEAFQPAAPGGALRAVEVGDITLWIDADAQLTLAAAVRGAAPRELRDTLHATRERIRREHATDYAAARPLLEECLRGEVRPTPRRAQRLLGLLGLAAVTAIAVVSLRACEHGRSDAALRAAYRDVLSTQPGVAVLSVERRGGHYKIVALADPRSAPIDTVIAAAGLPAATLDVRPFASSDPRLGPPLAALDQEIHQLETLEIAFPRGSASVTEPAPDIARAAQLVGRVRAESARHGLALCLEAIGHADESGREVVNAALRAARASSVADALVAAGVPRAMIASRPATATSDHVRAVRFRAGLRPQSHAHEECGA